MVCIIYRATASASDSTSVALAASDSTSVPLAASDSTSVPLAPSASTGACIALDPVTCAYFFQPLKIKVTFGQYYSCCAFCCTVKFWQNLLCV